MTIVLDVARYVWTGFTVLVVAWMLYESHKVRRRNRSAQELRARLAHPSRVGRRLCSCGQLDCVIGLIRTETGD